LENMKDAVAVQAKYAMDSAREVADTVDKKLGVSQTLHTVDEKIGITSAIEAIDNTVADSASHVYYSLKQGNPIHAMKHVVTAHTIGQAEKAKHEHGPLPELAHASQEVIAESHHKDATESEDTLDSQFSKESGVDASGGEPKNAARGVANSSLEPTLSPSSGIKEAQKERHGHKAKFGYHKKRRVGDKTVSEPVDPAPTAVEGTSEDI